MPYQPQWIDFLGYTRAESVAAPVNLEYKLSTVQQSVPEVSLAVTGSACWHDDTVGPSQARLQAAEPRYACYNVADDHIWLLMGS